MSIVVRAKYGALATMRISCFSRSMLIRIVVLETWRENSKSLTASCPPTPMKEMWNDCGSEKSKVESSVLLTLRLNVSNTVFDVFGDKV